MNHKLKERLISVIDTTNDFFTNIANEELGLKLSGLPSNTIGSQAWCLIGARESYMKAYVEEKWVGFTCSLTDTNNNELVNKKLTESRQMVIDLLDKHPGKPLDMIFELIEHEAMHQGQLIRYAYANKILFPKSWIHKYALEQVKK